MRVRLLLATLLLASAAIAAACGGGNDDDSRATPTPSEPAATAEPTPLPISELAHAVVQIQALAGDEPLWVGSGTIIAPEGLILTNAHVVDDRFDEYDRLGVAITEASDTPPELLYVGEIAAVDYSLDLALLQITEGIHGGPVDGEFPFVPIGDSDAVEIGDNIRILGYPVIGGQTITFTNGVVSGFTSERSVGNRAWIKTDAAISGGNSGGLAINEEGEVIGVPTVVGSGAGADSGYVDCRILQDTNGDGFVDESDSCIPVGGFLNGVRPVNLATEMIAAVNGGEEYVSPYYEEEFVDVPGEFDTTDIFFASLVFGPDATAEDQPTEVAPFFPSGAMQVCGFWDYEGMLDGMTWDALWYIDGELDESGSFIADTWVGGGTGTWWVCILDEVPLPDGLYELILQVEGEPIASESIFVGGDRTVVELDINNESSIEVCGVWVASTDAQSWGFEDLGPTVTVPPGEIWPLFVATGTYDILVRDCAANTLIEDYAVDILEDSTYTITDSGIQ
jgi:S1-C subfamily serine protease